MHSLSTNDASLGEYKYTVNVGNHSIKITGDCLELVRVSKLVLDEYFTSSEFLTSAEAGLCYDTVLENSSTIPYATQSKGQISTSAVLAASTQFIRTVSFPENDGGSEVDATVQMKVNCAEVDDDVFIVEENENGNVYRPRIISTISFSFIILIMNLYSADAMNTPRSNSGNQSVSSQSNGLNRSRRSYFSHGENATQEIPEVAIVTKECASPRISYENERLIFFSKSPHSWALPRDWTKICDKYPNIVRSKVIDKANNNNSVGMCN